MNDLEQLIIAKSLTAPRITPELIESNIGSEHYFNGIDGAMVRPDLSVYSENWEVPKTIQALELITFCILVLKNGYTVTGYSACADPKNFDAELGRQLAREDAISKVGGLMAYELKTLLTEASIG